MLQHQHEETMKEATFGLHLTTTWVGMVEGKDIQAEREDKLREMKNVEDKFYGTRSK